MTSWSSSNDFRGLGIPSFKSPCSLNAKQMHQNIHDEYGIDCADEVYTMTITRHTFIFQLPAGLRCRLLLHFNIVFND